ncbi:MAG TPA: hypothetical protein VHL09_12485 [Dehalococcoidia bacterium]|nr:hypothetical protein [Dehalococcoidia bacterium]
MSESEEFIWVRRQANDWRLAKYRLEDVSHIHWDRVKTGPKTPPQQMLTGLVSCEAAIEGEISHTGSHGPHPHEIKIHIIKKDNDAKVYARLLQQVGSAPK